MNTPTPAQLIRIEAEALLRLAARLEDGMSASFSQAVELVVGCGRRRGRVVVTGIGAVTAAGLGAELAEIQPRANVRVMLDLDGHPFCLCRETD